MDIEEPNSPYNEMDNEMEPSRRCDDVGSNGDDSEDAKGPVIVFVDNADPSRERNGNVGTNRSSSTTSGISEFISYRFSFWTKLIQERTLAIGLWVWCLFCLIDLGDDQEYQKTYLAYINIGTGFFLLLLWIHKQARDDLKDHQKQMMATTLIPTLFSSAFIFSFSPKNEVMSYPLKGLIVIVLGIKFCPRHLFEMIKLPFHSTATSNQARALVVGQWIWPALLSGSLFFSGISHSSYYGLLIAGNGFLLVLLWCNKLVHDEIEYHQKELIISDLIPTLLFFCLPINFRYYDMDKDKDLVYWDSDLDMDFYLDLVSFLSFAERFAIIWLIVMAIVVAITSGPHCLGMLDNATRKVFGSCFRQMEDSYVEELRAIEEQDERELRVQQARLAYLETAVVSSSIDKRNKMTLDKRKKMIRRRLRRLVITVIAIVALTIVHPLILNFLQCVGELSLKVSDVFIEAGVAYK
jgi:hypothetical protein